MNHLVEFSGQFMWCVNSGIKFNRYDRFTSGSEVSYLDLLCPGFHHDTLDRLYPDPWTEADEIGAKTVYQTEAL